MQPFRRLLLGVAVAVLAAPAFAQSDFPSKPIRLVVSFAAGGISDVLARALAIKLASNIGQQVIVENKPGAGTTIASEYIARSTPDGYTIWLQDVTTHAINASLYSKLPYDTVKDFTPITMVASTPLMLVSHPSIPARKVDELIKLIRSKPGQYAYGSSGNGTIVHLAGEMLKSAAGLDVLHVPYKGSAPATQAILGGEVSFVFSTMPPAVSNVKAGRLRALAVTTPKRVETVPDVPTMIESGLPDFDLVLYSGIFGPPGLPPTIVRQLNAEFAKVVNDPQIRAVYEKIGADPMTTTPAELAARMNEEIARLGKVVKTSGAKID
jgi:tripartite-type tricarboxylate transporter receptor subunit TctC